MYRDGPTPIAPPTPPPPPTSPLPGTVESWEAMIDMYDKHKPDNVEDVQEAIDPYVSLSVLAEQVLGAGRTHGGASGSGNQPRREAGPQMDIAHPVSRTLEVIPGPGGSSNHASNNDTPDAAESPLSALHPGNAGGDSAVSTLSGGTQNSNKLPRQPLLRFRAFSTSSVFPAQPLPHFSEHARAKKGQGELGNNGTSASDVGCAVPYSSPLTRAWDVRGVDRPGCNSHNHQAAVVHPLPPPGAWGLNPLRDSNPMFCLKKNFLTIRRKEKEVIR